MVIKEWGQLQRNFWLQMRGEQLMQGTMENWSEASHFQRKTN